MLPKVNVLHTMKQPILIIQGGAGRRSADPRRGARLRQKILRILNRSYERLCGTTALEAVTCAVKLLEEDPEFNAGRGSMLQADGRARLSASIMDGARLRFAGVINLEKIRNPILIARELLEEKARILSGEGALRFARERGFKTEDPRTRAALRRWGKWRQGKETGGDTVGACALDRFGNLASATSTGGRGYERPGRVSDSGMPVANYADVRCAVSATGIGEEIIDEGLAIRIATRVEDSLTLRQAFEKTFREIRSRRRWMGAVGLSAQGEIAHATTTDLLIFGWRRGRRVHVF